MNFHHTRKCPIEKPPVFLHSRYKGIGRRESPQKVRLLSPPENVQSSVPVWKQLKLQSSWKFWPETPAPPNSSLFPKTITNFTGILPNDFWSLRFSRKKVRAYTLLIVWPSRDKRSSKIHPCRKSPSSVPWLYFLLLNTVTAMQTNYLHECARFQQCIDLNIDAVLCIGIYISSVGYLDWMLSRAGSLIFFILFGDLLSGSRTLSTVAYSFKDFFFLGGGMKVIICFRVTPRPRSRLRTHRTPSESEVEAAFPSVSASQHAEAFA